MNAHSNHVPHHSQAQAQVVCSALAPKRGAAVDLSSTLPEVMLPQIPWGRALAPMCHLAHLVTTLEVVHPASLDFEVDAA